MRTPLGLAVGEDGVGVSDITSAYDAEGNTAVTVALTDGSTRSFTVQKGEGATYETATQSADGLMSAADKAKLDNIEAGAEANAIDGVQVNGTALSIAQKIVNLLILSGASDGAISVNGADVAVTGLAALAYKAEVAYADLAAALKAVIDGHTADLSTLIGSDTGKNVRTIANEELAAQLIPANAQEALDTLQEISAWIQSHPGEVADINRKLTLGTNNGAEYATVKAYVEAMVSGLITLSALSANVTGAGNAITGVAYDNTNGAFSFTKGQTFLTEHQDISGKVDKVSGKGLSTNDYTDAEKTKLSGIAAQANKTIIDITLSNAGQAADAKTTGDSFSALHNLISRMEIYCTASGNPATFSDADAANVKALSVTITLTQSGSGDPSPDNIRPISGVTSVSVTRTGKNLLNPAEFEVMSNFNNANWHLNRPIPLLGGVAYTFSCNLAVNGVYIRESRTGAIKYQKESSSEVVTDYTFTPSENMRAYILIWRNSGFNNFQGQLEEGSLTSYKAYRGQSVTVSLVDSNSNPLTVYGGTLDVTTGELSVQDKMFLLNTSAVSTSEPYLIWRNVPELRECIPQGVNSVISGIDNIGGTLRVNTLGDNNIIFITFPDSVSISELVARALDVQILLPLISPVTYQLTPQQLATLSGYNSVTTDAASVSVTYKADPVLSLGGGT